MKKLMLHVLLGCLILTPFGNVIAQPSRPEPLQSPASLQHWVQQNITCQGDFVLEMQDPQFVASLKKAGVRFSRIETDGPPSGLMRLPRNIHIEGFNTQQITYWADSGSEFFAQVQASVPALEHALNSSELPAAVTSHEHYTAGRFIHKPTKDDPFPPLLFIRATDNPKLTQVGCRTFDY
jgi:hypothetical protein